MDNSMCHNDCKVTDELANLKLDRVTHSPYSPDLSPCDFWLFGMLKYKIKDRVFQMVKEIMIAFHKIWEELTLDDLQSVFFNWIERLK
jgi:histone-lysine N-methyltransferase SETMAR